MTLTSGSIWKYTGKSPIGGNGEYVIVGLCRMKDRASRNWVDAVAYTKTGDPNLYVREKAEFLERFEQTPGSKALQDGFKGLYGPTNKGPT